MSNRINDGFSANKAAGIKANVRARQENKLIFAQELLRLMGFDLDAMFEEQLLKFEAERDQSKESNAVAPTAANG